MVARFVSLSAAIALLGCQDAKEPPPQVRRAPSAATAMEAPTLVALTRHFGGAKPGEPACVIVAVHGLGDRPESFAALFSDFDVRSRVVFPRAPDPWGPGFSWFPFRPGATDGERASALTTASQRLAAFVDALPANERRGKVVLTGFSQGGMLSFAVAALRPELVGTALPVSGTLPEPLWPKRRSGALPAIVAIHGDRDDRVPIEPTRQAVAAFASAGYSATLREHAGVSHTISPLMKRELFAALASACR